MPPDENGQATVRAAKITATQAIVVALITTFGGGLIGFFVNQGSISLPGIASAQVAHRWLVISNVEDPARRHVRLVVSVNGLYFSYPSRAVWTETGPQMSVEKFPLPASDDYKVAFSAFVTSPGAAETEETSSQEVVSIRSSQVPIPHR